MSNRKEAPLPPLSDLAWQRALDAEARRESAITQMRLRKQQPRAPILSWEGQFRDQLERRRPAMPTMLTIEEKSRWLDALKAQRGLEDAYFFRVRRTVSPLLTFVTEALKAGVFDYQKNVTRGMMAQRIEEIGQRLSESGIISVDDSDLGVSRFILDLLDAEVTAFASSSQQGLTEFSPEQVHALLFPPVFLVAEKKEAEHLWLWEQEPEDPDPLDY